MRKKLGFARRFLGMGFACAALVTGLGFDAKNPPPRRVPASCPRERPVRVVLVAIDGVRWQDVFEGTDEHLLSSKTGSMAEAASAEALTPHLHQLIRTGVALGAPGHGEPFLASGPNFVSLPGYSELLNGRPASCYENDCTVSASFSLLDGFSQHYDPRTIASISSWTNIERVAASPSGAAFVSAGRTGGATRESMSAEPILGPVLDRGAAESSDPVGGDYRSDESTVALALAFLDVERPPFLFVSLGDTDEYAHHMDYPNYLRALRRADAFIGEVMQLADDWRSEGVDTVIIVTADHGRAADFEHHGRDWPESARSWLIASGGPIPAHGYVDSPSPRHLRDVAPTIAAIAGVEIEMAPTTGIVLPELAPHCH